VLPGDAALDEPARFTLGLTVDDELLRDSTGRVESVSLVSESAGIDAVEREPCVEFIGCVPVEHEILPEPFKVVGESLLCGVVLLASEFCVEYDVADEPSGGAVYINRPNDGPR